MINAIIKAISISLNGEFGKGYTNYTDEIKQGLKEPCFFISCINPEHNLFLGKRYYRTNLFSIQYFPADKLNESGECHAVAERMEFCLEWLSVDGDKVMGSDMRYEIIDGVLNFFVNYNMFVYKKIDTVLMESISTDIGADR